MRGRVLLVVLGAVAALVVSQPSAGGQSVLVSGPRVRTLFASTDRIWAFALGPGRLTWIGQAQLPGRGPGCGMYVRSLRTGRTSVAPLPHHACSRRLGGVHLGSGAAAWVTGDFCSNLECDWNIVGVSAGARRPRQIDSVGGACDYECGSGYGPVPALAGADGEL